MIRDRVEFEAVHVVGVALVDADPHLLHALVLAPLINCDGPIIVQADASKELTVGRKGYTNDGTLVVPVDQTE